MSDKEFSIRLAEKAYRIAYFDAADVISESNISLLVERVTNQEIERLKKHLATTRKAMNDLREMIPDQMTNVVAYLDKIDAEFGDINPAKIKLVGNKKRVAKIIGSASAASEKMQSITQSVTTAFEDLKSAIASDDSAKQSLKDNAEDVRNLSIEQYMEKHDGLGSLDDATFRKGIQNAYSPPPKAKGFFARIVRALGFEAMPPSDAKFVEDLMKIPLEKIIAWKPTPAMGGVSTPQANDTIGDATTAAAEDVENLSDPSRSDAADSPGESPEQVEDREAQGEEAPTEPEDSPDLPRLSDLLFEPIDPEDREKGMKMKEPEGRTAKAIETALSNIADTSLRSSYEGLKNRPNTANRRSFLSNLRNLKGALDQVKLESKEENGELMIERWNKLAGMKDE